MSSPRINKRQNQEGSQHGLAVPLASAPLLHVYSSGNKHPYRQQPSDLSTADCVRLLLSSPGFESPPAVEREPPAFKTNMAADTRPFEANEVLNWRDIVPVTYGLWEKQGFL